MTDSLFQIGGLASGVDTNGIIDAMMKLASRPITNLQKEKQILSYKQEAYNNLSVKLLGLQAQMSNLADEDFFTTRTVNSTNKSVATATAESGALQTTYNLTVDNIATSTTEKSSQNVTSSSAVSTGSGITTEAEFNSAGFASTPSGTITITMDNGNSQTFDLANYNSVDEFMWAVNHDTNIDVRMEYDKDTDKFSLYSLDQDGFSISETAGASGTGFFTAVGFFREKTSTDTVSSGSGIDLTKSFADAGFKNTIDGTVTINGKTFDPNSYDTVEQFINAVNADSDAQVTLSYDSATDKFTIKSDVLGKRINLSESGIHPFFSEVNIDPEYVNGIDPNQDLVNADTHIPVEDGSIFRINGVEFNVDTNVDSLNDIIQDINNSNAGVIAFYDPSTDTLSLQSKETGAKTISLQDVKGNFLKAFKLADSNDTYTSSKEVVAGAGTIDTSKSWSDAGFTNTPDGSVLINGIEFKLADYATVDDFMNAINNDSRINANISYNSTTDKFTITSTDGNNLELAETGTNPFLTEAKVEYGRLVGVEELGEDAHFTLNGTAMSKSENTFKMNGTTFTLNGAGSTTITIGNDNEKIIDSVKSFVKAYNDTVDYLREKLTEKSVADPKSADDFKKGILNGDSTLLEIQNQLREIVSSQVGDLDGKYNELQDIGINSGPVGSSVEVIALGHLFVDEDKLRSVLNDDPSKVAEIFGKDWVEVDGEVPTGAKDGVNKTFQIAHTPVSFAMQPVVRINDGTPLTQVFGTTTVPQSGQFKLNYTTGELVLGDAPSATDTLTIDYKYRVEGGENAGIAIRLLKKLKNFTDVNTGLIDSQIKSLEDRGEDIDERIQSIQYRLDLEKRNLVEKYAAMEENISQLKSQGDYLAAQLASLNGTSNKK